MDKFESGDSIAKIEEETQKIPVLSSKTNRRSLWAVSMCSLVAIASLSFAIVSDHNRISQIAEKLAQRRADRADPLQRVLALAQVQSSASYSASLSGSATITQTTQAASDSTEANHLVIDAFSSAVHD